MITTVVHALAVFVGAVLGLGLPLVSKLPYATEERMVLAWFSGLLMIYLLATAFFLAEVNALFWPTLCLPSLAGWWLGRNEAVRWWQDSDTRRALLCWAALTTWLLLALSFVRNYSGGDWIGDWAGHYHRAHYFLHQIPADRWIFERDPLMGRPPLQNLITAALLGIGNDRFASYQIFTLLLGTLVVFPTVLLVKRCCAPAQQSAALAWTTALLAVNPLVVQNATYPWTKLGASAWILVGVAWALRGGSSSAQCNVIVAVTAFSAGTLAHYFGAVYLIAFGAVACWRYVQECRDPVVWRCSLLSGLVASLLFASWFGWAVAREGWGAIHSSTTTAMYLEKLGWQAQLGVFIQNLIRTGVPHAFLQADHQSLDHLNTWAKGRDWLFCIYQTCLPGALGIGVLATLARGRVPGVPAKNRILAMAPLILIIVLLGVAVHTAPTRWGAAHISLQPIVVLALGAAAVRLSEMSAPWRRFILACLALDFALGVVWHLAIEHLSVPANALLWHDGEPLRQLFGRAVWSNAATKAAFQYVFLGDLPGAPVTVRVGLAALILYALMTTAYRLTKPKIALAPQTSTVALPP